jgi:copper chaperone CopZ
MIPQTTITLLLSGVHICCQGCVDAIDVALKNIAGVESQCDMTNGTVTLTFSNEAATEKALAAIAAAGFHGKSNNKHFVMQPVSDIPRGKVKSLRVSGIHNCCDLCSAAIKEAIATVDGVGGDTCQTKATNFEITGDFNAAAVVAALNAAGFSARVK